MAFGNAKLILKNVSGLGSLKLLLLKAKYSRPTLRPLCNFLLSPFERNGEIPIDYKKGGRNVRVFIRDEDQESDMHSMLEVVVRNVYPLDPAYAADLIIDGGANIGLFSLQAAAVFPDAKILVCEPLPRNTAQVEKHLTENHVDNAELLPICIGGTHRTIPFYCREANASSFDAAKPYDSVLNIDVLSLKEIVNQHPANRILIKLDIEGMEVEALETYIPGEQRPVVIYGELHDYKKRRSALEHLLAANGWSLQLGELGGDDIIFEARSPAAVGFGA